MAMDKISELFRGAGIITTDTKPGTSGWVIGFAGMDLWTIEECLRHIKRLQVSIREVQLNNCPLVQILKEL